MKYLLTVIFTGFLMANSARAELDQNTEFGLKTNTLTPAEYVALHCNNGSADGRGVVGVDIPWSSKFQSVPNSKNEIFLNVLHTKNANMQALQEYVDFLINNCLKTAREFSVLVNIKTNFVLVPEQEKPIDRKPAKKSKPKSLLSRLKHNMTIEEVNQTIGYEDDSLVCGFSDDTSSTVYSYIFHKHKTFWLVYYYKNLKGWIALDDFNGPCAENHYNQI